MLCLLLLQILFLSSAQALAAPTVPAKPADGTFVVDEVGVLSAQTETVINTYTRALSKRTKAQIAVLTIKSLQGEAPEEYALTVLRQWGIGDRKLNNGVLILVAVDDRRSRIEVGYGLEGALTDGLAGRIQDDYMLPYFRQGNYDKGVARGYTAVLQTVLKEYGLEIKNLDVSANTRFADDRAREINMSDVAAFIVVALILFGFFFGGPGGGGGGFRRTQHGGIFYGGGFFGGGFGGGGFSGGGGFGGGSGGGGGAGRGW